MLSGWGDEGRLGEFWRRVSENAWTWEELSGWARRTVHAFEDRTKSLFLYLTGENDSSSPKYPYDTGVQKSSQSLERRETQIGKTSGSGGLWASVTGLFSGVGKSVLSTTGSSSSASSNELYEDGEVHCDLIRVSLSKTLKSSLSKQSLLCLRTTMGTSCGDTFSLTCRVRGSSLFPMLLTNFLSSKTRESDTLIACSLSVHQASRTMSR